MNKSNYIRNTFSLLLFIVCSTSWAQESSIKLYSNFLYLNSEFLPNRYPYETKPFVFDNISLAFRRITKGEMIHELEAKVFLKKQNDASGQVKWEDVQVRYQLGAYVATLFDRVKIQPAGALTIFHSKEEVEVANFNEYKVTNDQNGFNLSFFIHTEFLLTKQLYMDINTSFVGLALYLDYTQIDNPPLFSV